MNMVMVEQTCPSPWSQTRENSVGTVEEKMLWSNTKLGRKLDGQSWNNCEYVDSNDSDLEQEVVVVESKEVGKQEEEEFSILVVDVRIPLCS